MHSKWFTAPNFDNFDPDLNSFTIIVDNLNVKTHPQVLAFNGRQTEHRCFDPSMHARSGHREGPDFTLNYYKSSKIFRLLDQLCFRITKLYNFYRKDNKLILSKI